MLGPESYGERLETIGGIVRSRLPVKEVAYVEGVLTFRLLTRDIKERFREIYHELTRIGFVPAAVEVGGQVELRVLPYSQPQTRRSPWPLVLFWPRSQRSFWMERYGRAYWEEGRWLVEDS